MNKPLVSILIPVYNAEKYVAEAIESALNQTHRNIEIIIIDDGSTDKSIEIVLEMIDNDPRIKLLKRNREPKGAATCRNIGISESTGKYIIFLDSDDILSKDCLIKRVDYMERNKELDFAVFQMQSLGNKRQLLTKNKPDYLKAFLSFDLPWTITCPIWKREYILTLGGFDENFQRLQDPEFHVRALVKKPKYTVLFDTEPDCFYRPCDESKRTYQFIFNQLKGYYHFINKFMNNDYLSKDDKVVLKKILILYFFSITYPVNKEVINMLIRILELIKKNNFLTSSKYYMIKNFVLLIPYFNSLILQKILIRLSTLLFDIREFCLMHPRYNIFLNNIKNK